MLELKETKNEIEKEGNLEERKDEFEINTL